MFSIGVGGTAGVMEMSRPDSRRSAGQTRGTALEPPVPPHLSSFGPAIADPCPSHDTKDGKIQRTLH